MQFGVGALASKIGAGRQERETKTHFISKEIMTGFVTLSCCGWRLQCGMFLEI